MAKIVYCNLIGDLPPLPPASLPNFMPRPHQTPVNDSGFEEWFGTQGTGTWFEPEGPSDSQSNERGMNAHIDPGPLPQKRWESPFPANSEVGFGLGFDSQGPIYYAPPFSLEANAAFAPSSSPLYGALGLNDVQVHPTVLQTPPLAPFPASQHNFPPASSPTQAVNPPTFIPIHPSTTINPARAPLVTSTVLPNPPPAVQYDSPAPSSPDVNPATPIPTTPSTVIDPTENLRLLQRFFFLEKQKDNNYRSSHLDGYPQRGPKTGSQKANRRGTGRANATSLSKHERESYPGPSLRATAVAKKSRKKRREGCSALGTHPNAIPF